MKKEVLSKNIHLGTQPYTYARVCVMRSELLKKEEYQKIMKMKLNEIIEFLQETQYKKEINELAMNYSGVDLIEMALNKNLINTFLKLKNISKKELSYVIGIYLKRLDFWNIKTIIRGKYVKADEKEIESMLLPAGFITKDELMELMKKESIEETLKSSELVPFFKIEAACRNFKETNSLAEIENAFDHEYYEGVIRTLPRLPREGRLFMDFLKAEIETINILTLLRLKRANVNKEKIKEYMLTIKGAGLLHALAETEDTEGLIGLMERTRYSEIIKKGVDEFKEKNTLMKIEIELYKNLLRKSLLLLHQHPLSVDVILGYMFAKEIEVKNLKMIIKSKQLGLEDEFIEEQLVV